MTFLDELYQPPDTIKRNTLFAGIVDRNIFSSKAEDEEGGIQLIRRPSRLTKAGRRPKELTEVEMNGTGLAYRPKSFPVIASEEVVDRMDDIVDQKGLSFTEFRENPILLYNHQVRAGQPIGQVLQIWTESGREPKRSPAIINFSEKTELAREIGDLFREGVLRTVSIGFMPIKVEPRSYPEGYEGPRFGLRFVQSILRELSVVTIPALPSATSELRSALEKSKFDLTKYPAYRKEVDTLIDCSVADSELREGLTVFRGFFTPPKPFVQVPEKEDSQEKSEDSRELLAQIKCTLDTQTGLITELRAKLNAVEGKLDRSSEAKQAAEEASSEEPPPATKNAPQRIKVRIV